MALFAKIVHGSLLDVGPLPQGDVRWDTAEVVLDLAGTNAMWQRACGWYSVAELNADPSIIVPPPTPEQSEAIRTAIIDAVLAQNHRRQFIADLRTDAAAAKGTQWDFIDGYSPIPLPGSQDPGTLWPQPPPNPTQLQLIGTLSDRVEILRLHDARSSYHLIRIVDVILLMIDVLEDLIDAVDIEPPEPR